MFFKCCVPLGEECITLNHGVVFILEVVMFCKRPHVKISNDLEIQTEFQRLCNGKLAGETVFCGFLEVTYTKNNF